MKRPEPSIRPGITEVECKLTSLHLNRNGVCGRGGEIHARPGSASKNSEGENLRFYQQESRNDQALGSAGKLSDLRILFPVGKFPDKDGQNELCGQKRDSGLRH